MPVDQRHDPNLPLTSVNHTINYWLISEGESFFMGEFSPTPTHRLLPIMWTKLSWGGSASARSEKSPYQVSVPLFTSGGVADQAVGRIFLDERHPSRQEIATKGM